ncbi:Fur family transcriptional regulator [Streptomyces sp. NPDC050560]|uniref:Fur family transcriptional regulator n=1 Tax=Streptomyces sp. NPDC050560 TaxID=3365630 RepID=UPI00379E88F6
MGEHASAIRVAEVMDRFGELSLRVRNRLWEHRLRATPSRIAVMAALARAPGLDRRDTETTAPGTDTPSIPGHLTVPGLQRAIETLDIPLDGVTVYRAVTTLTDVDLIHPVTIRDRASRYGLNHPRHHHAVCDTCGTLRSLPADDVTDLLTSAADLARFSLPDCGALTLHGRCTPCQSNHG